MIPVVITGKDTLKIAGRPVSDLADGDVGMLEFSNELTKTKRGKNGNSIIADDQSGGQGDLTFRVLRGSADDQYFNGLLASQRADLPGSVLLSGELVKRLGDGLGNIKKDRYLCSAGTFKKIPGVTSNVEGNTDQGVTIYAVHFADVQRIIG